MLNNPSIFKSSVSITKPVRAIKPPKVGASDEVANREAHAVNSGYHNLVAELEDYQIGSIAFSLLSDEKIKSLSVTQISIADKTSADNCVNSRKMGSTRREEICTYCKLQFPHCNGHYGHIELPTPIINPLFKRELVKVLSVLCHNCCNIRATYEYIESVGINKLPQDRRLQELSKLVGKEMTCPHCKKANYEIAPGDHGPNYINIKGRAPLKMDEILTLLHCDRLTPDIVKILGYEGGSHPRHIIMTSILVIPPVHRPDVIIDGRVKSADLTDAYASIIRACTDYTETVRLGKLENEKNAKLERISREIHKLFTNPDGTAGKDPKGILETFKGKEGVTRQVQGRRSNLNARSVLGPAPELNFGELAIPVEQAKALLRPETVTQFNLKKMKEFMATGKVESITVEGKTNKIRITDSNRWEYVMKLKPGDIVYRHTMDGDVVIFNRQPTLQPESMGGYRVKVHDKRTIGMHLSATTPHNADFDGDEGNVFGLVGQQSVAEVEYIMGTWNNIISSQSARPNFGLVMNALSGGYALTANGVLVSRELFYECIDVMDEKPDMIEFMKRAIDHNGEIYYGESDNLIRIRDHDTLNLHKPTFFGGRVLFSVFLPPTLQYKKGNVVIKDGILMSGQTASAHIGGSTGSIVQVIYSDYGAREACRFITNATRVLDIYAYRRGITVGIYDYCPWLGNTEKKNALDDTRRKIIAKLRGKISELPIPDACDIEMNKKYENTIVEHMEQAINDMGAAVLSKFTDKDGGIAIMANSGAKGSTVNAAHTTGMIGPQYDRGKRMTLCITNNTRTTPYVVPGETDVSARGFITSNYSEGVTPLDAAHAAVFTRNAIVDTAVGVADNGYLSRRLVRFNEDVTTEYNGGVVLNAIRGKGNDLKRTVSLIYGDDNYDTTKIELVETPLGKIFIPVDISRIVARLNSRFGYFSNDDIQACAPYTGPIIYED